MKVVVATDSFKDCLSSTDACAVITDRIKKVRPDVMVVCKPLADGGEGTAHILMQALGGKRVVKLVNGPLPGHRVRAGFVWCEDTKTAIVEMAEASGLQRLKSKDRNPLNTTTLGTGQLLQAAVQQGASRILLTVGGSATVDMGIGMAHALGWQFIDYHEQSLVPIGRNLIRIKKIVPPPKPWTVPIEVLCDVTNPVLGYNGAARVFAPQKGADRAGVVLLEVGLTHLVELIKEQFNINLRSVPSGGAAGGLSAGAAVFLNAYLKSGADTVLGYTGFYDAIYQADWVVTGEGCFDQQSLGGKLVSGVIQACKGTTAKVVVMAGQVNLTTEAYQSVGIHHARAITPEGMPLAEALKEGKALLQQSAQQWAEKYLAMK